MTRTALLLLPILMLSVPAAGAEDPPAKGPPPGTGVVPANLPEPRIVSTSSGDLPVPATPLSAQPENRAAAETALPEPAEAPDEPEIQKEIQAESAELEELRQAEETSNLLEPMRPDDRALRSSARLGLESPLRLRLRDAFGREVPPDATLPGSGRIALIPELDRDLRALQAEFDIPIDVNEEVRTYIRFFQTEPVRAVFVRWLQRSHRYLARYREIMRQHGLPEDTVYLAMIESGFANLAYSRARASGPWQFIGETGRHWGLKQDFWVDERRDPEKSAHAAAKYLRELFGQTGDWRLAWAGYNAGVGKILRAQRAGQSDFWSMVKGRVLKSETKNYVPKLMAAAIVSKHPQAFGFGPDEIDPESWVDYELVTIRGASELSAIARAANVSERALLELNPELRRSCTPPRPYALKLPKGTGETFAENWPALECSARLTFAHHRMQRGDTLGAVAAAYGVSVSTLLQWNGLQSHRRVRNGTDLVIPVSASRRHGAPVTEVAARERIEEIQRRNPSLVAQEPPPRASAPVRYEPGPAGRMKATVLVREGDSLWVIAQRFGVEVTEVCRWNGIRNPRRQKLKVGRELVIYPRSAGREPSGHAQQRS